MIYEPISLKKEELPDGEIVLKNEDDYIIISFRYGNQSTGSGYNKTTARINKKTMAQNGPYAVKIVWEDNEDGNNSHEQDAMCCIDMTSLLGDETYQKLVMHYLFSQERSDKAKDQPYFTPLFPFLGQVRQTESGYELCGDGSTFYIIKDSEYGKLSELLERKLLIDAKEHLQETALPAMLRKTFSADPNSQQDNETLNRAVQNGLKLHRGHIDELTAEYERQCQTRGYDPKKPKTFIQDLKTIFYSGNLNHKLNKELDEPPHPGTQGPAIG